MAQRETVLETLRDLKTDPNLISEMIHVGNKIDKLEKVDDEPNVHFVSCKDGRGIAELMSFVEKVFVYLLNLEIVTSFCKSVDKISKSETSLRNCLLAPLITC